MITHINYNEWEYLMNHYSIILLRDGIFYYNNGDVKLCFIPTTNDAKQSYKDLNRRQSPNTDFICWELSEHMENKILLFRRKNKIKKVREL